MEILYSVSYSFESNLNYILYKKLIAEKKSIKLNTVNWKIIEVKTIVPQQNRQNKYKTIC